MKSDSSDNPQVLKRVFLDRAMDQDLRRSADKARRGYGELAAEFVRANMAHVDVKDVQAQEIPGSQPLMVPLNKHTDDALRRKAAQSNSIPGAIIRECIKIGLSK